MLMKKKLLKLTITLFTFCLLLFAKVSFGKSRAGLQSDRNLITLELRNASLSNAIKLMSKQAQMYFVYNEDDLDIYPNSHYSIKEKTLEEALSTVLQRTTIDFVIEKDVVILKPKKEAAAVKKQSTIAISGIITDEFGNPVPGVTIAVIDSRTITTSNENGFYFIRTKDNSAIRFSMMGMDSHVFHVSAKGKAEITHSFVLKESTLEIDNVVVTGYQTFKRSNVPGAISSVKMQDLTQIGAISVDQMLQGKIAGMSVTGVVGNPGAPPKIRVRGTSSITGDQEPIWVVDGVIWDEPVPIRNRDLATADDLTLFNMVGGSIAGLNPNDIESIDVLKDASATAIYGVKAVNGVIVVTTKKGKTGAARINYSTNVQTRERPAYSDFNLMNAAERLTTAEEIYRSGAIYPRFPGKTSYEGLLLSFLRKDITQSDFDKSVLELASHNTDWFDLLFRNSISQNHTMSMSGGINNASYYFSGGYFDEQSNTRGSGLKRYNGTMRLVNKFSDKFEADVKIGLGIRNNKGFHPSINPYDYAIKTSRALPAYHANGDLFFYEVGNPTLIDGVNHFHTYNVFNELEQTNSQSTAKEMNAMLNLHWKMLPWLSWTGTAAYNTTQTLSEQWATEHSYNVSYGLDAYGNRQRGYPYGLYKIGSPNYDRSKLPMGGTLLNENMSANSYTVRNQFMAEKIVNEDHRFHLIAGQEVRSTGYQGNKELLYGFFPDRGKMVIPPTTTGYKDFLSEFKPVQFTDKASNYFSLFSILNYAYKEKYILNGSIRYDGSNVFGKDATYRFLPVWSAAGKWIASEENFFKDMSAISFMALRASYGLQGNIRSDASPSLVISVNDLDTETGKYKASIASLPNPNLRWEKTSSYNVGYELSLFNALNLTFDYYYKKGENLIIDKAVSTVSGRNNILLNAGNMENKGMEITLSAFPIKRNTFSWNSTLIGAQNRNKITRADVAIEGVTSKMERAAKLTGKSVIEGDAYGTLYAYRYKGLNNKGWPTFAIQDGTNGFMSSETNIIMDPIGSSEPKLTGGWDNTFRYKNISLAVSLTYNLGYYRRLHDYYADENSSTSLPDHYENYPREFASRWRNPGDELRTNTPVLMDYIEMITAGGPHSTPTENGFNYSLNSSTGIHMHELYNKSDLRVVKADYIRLRAINLFYNMPQGIIKNTPINQMTFSLSIQNLGFWAPDKEKFFGQDPELLGNPYATPIPTIVNFGINASF